jgi:hypothetical protein
MNSRQRYLETLTFGKPDGEEFVMGNVYGQGELGGELLPLAPGDAFIGSVGATPEPATLGLLSLGAAALLRRKK